VGEENTIYMSESRRGGNYPEPRAADAFGPESKEQRSVTDIAGLLAKKLTHDEMSDVVMAIEDSDFHAAVRRQWRKMPHPEAPLESVD
jgi:hypothetical protein